MYNGLIMSINIKKKNSQNFSPMKSSLTQLTSLKVIFYASTMTIYFTEIHIFCNMIEL